MSESREIVLLVKFCYKFLNKVWIWRKLILNMEKQFLQKMHRILLDKKWCFNVKRLVFNQLILIEFVSLIQEELEEKKLEWEEIYEKDTKARKAELKSLEVTWPFKYKYK